MNKKGSQIQWTISWVMIALFTVAIISFSIGFASDNDASMSIANDKNISKLLTDTNTEVNGINTGFSETSGSILNSSVSPTSASGTLTTMNPFSITFTNFIGVSYNILNIAYSKIFGTNNGFQIFLVTFIGMIGFITALLIWKTFRGQPD